MTKPCKNESGKSNSKNNNLATLCHSIRHATTRWPFIRRDLQSSRRIEEIDSIIHDIETALSNYCNSVRDD